MNYNRIQQGIKRAKKWANNWGMPKGNENLDPARLKRANNKDGCRTVNQSKIRGDSFGYDYHSHKFHAYKGVPLRTWREERFCEGAD